MLWPGRVEEVVEGVALEEALWSGYRGEVAVEDGRVEMVVK